MKRVSAKYVDAIGVMVEARPGAGDKHNSRCW